MSKQKIFLDYDSTIVDSIKAFMDVYNEKYIKHPNFIKADWYKAEPMHLLDQCTLLDHVDEIFGSKRFFEVVEFINPNTKRILKEICQEYDVRICSIGIPSNLAYKAWWIEENLPFINESILLMKKHCKMDKSVVNMSGENSIIIDDSEKNLISSNADYKICFGEVNELNNTWNGIRTVNWNDLGNLLL